MATYSALRGRLDLTPNMHYLITIVDGPPAVNSNGEPLNAEPEPDAQSLTDEAWQLYDEKLKILLEPQFLGQVVAVDLDSEGYEVAKRSALAWRPLKVRRPNAGIVVLDIGPVSPYDTPSTPA